MSDTTITRLRTEVRRTAPDLLNLKARVGEFLGVPFPAGFVLNENDTVRFLDQRNFDELILEREPFFFIDKAIALNDKDVWGVGTMTIERSAGHFPGRPIVPLIELCKMIAQTGSIVAALQASGNNEVPVAVSAGKSKALARSFVDAPVDLLIHATLIDSRMGLHGVNGTIYAHGERIGSLNDILYTLMHREKVLKQY